MYGILRTVAVLLLITMACAVPGAQAQMFRAAQASHPAGCHGHRPAIPSRSHLPAPASYQCCVNGHHAAIPNAAFSLRSLAAQLCSLDVSDTPHLNVVSCFHSAVYVVLASSPPGAAPLRI